MLYLVGSRVTVFGRPEKRDSNSLIIEDFRTGSRFRRQTKPTSCQGGDLLNLGCRTFKLAGRLLFLQSSCKLAPAQNAGIVPPGGRKGDLISPPVRHLQNLAGRLRFLQSSCKILPGLQPEYHRLLPEFVSPWGDVGGDRPLKLSSMAFLRPAFFICGEPRAPALNLCPLGGEGG